MTRNMETSALLFLLFVALLCNSLGQAAYFYNRGTNTGTNPHSKPSGYYPSGLSSQHHINHHKNHQHHNSNNGRLQQAAVGVISRGRLVPYTASTITTTTTPSSRLSPLDRLMNRLDSEEKQSSHHHQNHFTRFEQGKRHHELPSYSSHTNRQHGTVSPTFLRSSDNRFAQMRSNADDSYEDDDEDDDDEEEEDVLDDGDNREDEEDEDEDEEDEEEEELNAGRHHHKSQNHHRGGHSSGRDATWFDGAVADFPDHTSYTSSGGGAVIGSGSGLGSGSGSGSGTDTRFGGYNSYSEFKWNTLNQRNMEILRNQKGTYKTHTSDADISKAVNHALKVNKEGLCRVPKPRLIRVKDVFPHPSKTYFPHCTILHQCGDDTGCCRSDTLTCIARHTELVELYFYTTTLGGSGGPRTRNNPVVEKLEFHNHTECACVDRFEEFMPRDRPSSSSELDNLGKSGFRGYLRPDSDTSRTSSGTAESNTCRCTSQFSARHVADGSCVCECFDKQRDCIRSKRGKEFLPHSDRICVLRGECTTPSCEFGSYLRRAGRCPRKREKFETWQQYPLHDEEYK